MQTDHHRKLADRHLPEGLLLIDGKWIRPETGKTIDHVSPTTGEAQKSFCVAGPRETSRAVDSARKALPKWRGLPGGERRDVLLKIAELLEANRENLGSLSALDNGTPLLVGPSFSSDAPSTWFRYYSGWADKLEGAVSPADPNAFNFSCREPYGVVAAIVAFNAPMSFMGLKVAAALAAGNTVVIKPSDLAPWSVLRFGEICCEAGVPDGVVNVITGDGETGSSLVSHPDIDKISFTGGDATARAIMSAAAQNLTPLSLELGGKSASIILEDADVESAVSIALQVSLGVLSGQACIAGTRLLVQQSIYDRVCEALILGLSALKVGDPLEMTTHIGPVISEFHCNRILNAINDAEKRRDGKLIAGGTRLNGEFANGCFVDPAVFVDVDADSVLAQDEIFGPVLSITPFQTAEEAVAMANNSRYGLAAYIFTENLKLAHQMSKAIEAGSVCVNTLHAFPPSLPFGGMKSSGFGREGGLDGILDMTHSKAVQISLN